MDPENYDNFGGVQHVEYCFEYTFSFFGWDHDFRNKFLSRNVKVTFFTFQALHFCFSYPFFFLIVL